MHNWKMILTAIYSMALVLFIAVDGWSQTPVVKPSYEPDDPQLYQAILKQDSLFFQAYNTCSDNLALYASYYSDSMEFYHDKSGLSTSKTAIVDATKKNICGKVTRELVKGSVEVYPIRDFGAIEIGYHLFHNKEEPNAVPHPGRFVIVWQHQGELWKITRVISLH
jgi:hypothetical protein